MSDGLTLQIYSSGTTPIFDTAGELLNAQDLFWSTFAPGGVYGDAGIYIPRDVSQAWHVEGGQRVVIRDGQLVVYEGKIASVTDNITETDEGTWLDIIGLWDHDLDASTWRKNWSDDRTSEAIWPVDLDAVDGAITVNPELGFIDRRERLKFVPKAEAWADGDFMAVMYTQPYGETTARITYKVTLQEAAQSWEISLWRSPDNSTWTQMDAGSGETYNTGSTTVIVASATDTVIDVEPAAGTRYLQFRYYSRAAQTPTSDNTYYAAVEDLLVYSEDEGAAKITLQTVAADIAAEFTGIINSTKLHTPSTARTIEPFITQGFEELTSIITRAGMPGDGDDNRMNWGLLHSESVASPDGLPVLFTSEYPALTSYDYFISPESGNLVGSLRMELDYEGIYNYFPVQFRNKDGITKYLDPDETTSLKDATSITDYGTRSFPLNLGNQTAATAQAWGEKQLAYYKDPRYRNTTVRVSGYILDSNEQKIPASQIAACDSAGVVKRIYVDGYETMLVSMVRCQLMPSGVVDTIISAGPINAPLWGQEYWEAEFDDSIRGYDTDDSGDSGDSGGGQDMPAALGLSKWKKQNPAKWKIARVEIQKTMRRYGLNRKKAFKKLGGMSWLNSL